MRSCLQGEFPFLVLQQLNLCLRQSEERNPVYARRADQFSLL